MRGLRTLYTPSVRFPVQQTISSGIFPAVISMQHKAGGAQEEEEGSTLSFPFCFSQASHFARPAAQGCLLLACEHLYFPQAICIICIQVVARTSRLLSLGGRTLLVKKAGLLCVYVANRGLFEQAIQGQLVVVARIIWYLYFGILRWPVPIKFLHSDTIFLQILQTHLYIYAMIRNYAKYTPLTHLCGLVKFLLQAKSNSA